ncbi:MAG: hypothetical protein LBD43_03395 [Holosporales bacterium]|nr:hypothetical protein [Holosporales bacterium]
MNSKKILLCVAACLVYGMVCNYDVRAEYSGTDPKVDLLEDRLNELQNKLGELMKDTQERINNIGIKTIRDDIDGLTKETKEIKAGQSEASKKVEELTGKPTVTEETFNQWKEKLETQLAEMKKTIDELAKKPNVTKDEVEALGTAIQTIATQIANNKDSTNLAAINEQLQTINGQLQAMQEQQSAMQEQQRTEQAERDAAIAGVKGEIAMVKAATEANKAAKATQGIGSALGAAGSAIASLFGGGKTAQQTLTPEEQKKQEAIMESVKTGKTNPTALQEAQDKLNKQISQRLKDETMPKYTFWGANPKFQDRTVIVHIILESRAQRRPDASNLLGNKATPNDQEIIDAIYGLVQQGATVDDILNRVKLVPNGAPRKIVTPPMQQQVAQSAQTPDGQHPQRFVNNDYKNRDINNDMNQLTQGEDALDTTWDESQEQQNWNNQGGGNTGEPHGQRGNQQNWSNQGGGNTGEPHGQRGNQQNWNNQGGGNTGEPHGQRGNQQNWNNQGRKNATQYRGPTRERTMVVTHEGEKTYFEVPVNEFMQIATRVRDPLGVKMNGTEYRPLNEQAKRTLAEYVGKAK